MTDSGKYDIIKSKIANYLLLRQQTKSLCGYLAVIGGENNLFVLALWKHGGYAYCLELSEGVPEETVARIIAQTAAQIAQNTG